MLDIITTVSVVLLGVWSLLTTTQLIELLNRVSNLELEVNSILDPLGKDGA